MNNITEIALGIPRLTVSQPAPNMPKLTSNVPLPTLARKSRLELGEVSSQSVRMSLGFAFCISGILFRNVRSTKRVSWKLNALPHGQLLLVGFRYVDFHE